ncbi:MAG: hypothetical protein ACK55Z_20630, partial [bacterium]
MPIDLDEPATFPQRVEENSGGGKGSRLLEVVRVVIHPLVIRLLIRPNLIRVRCYQTRTPPVHYLHLLFRVVLACVCCPRFARA